MAEELMLKVEDVYKRYRLGTIGGGTLTADLQSWWAKVRHKEDPNSKIGAKTYGKNEVFYALNGISFEVRKGEALGIIGGNGAGKSTTLKLISQVTAPTEGKIYLNGRITSMLEVGTGFHPELTGRENIYLNGAILGMTKAEIDKKIEEIIDFSECRQFIDTPVKRYSSGMYVKLAFSVAAHLDSEIMIMDEVLAVGDMAFQKKCIDKMKSIANDEGRTILYVSHNMNTIRQLCDRCVVLDKGKVIFEGDVEKAIEVYMNFESSTFPTNYDCNNVLRDDLNFGKKAFIQSVNFLDKNSAIYDSGEKIKIEVVWKSIVNIDNVGVRMAVKQRTSGNIGMAQSKETLIGKEGDVNRSIFELDLSNLCDGEYYIKLFLYESDMSGNVFDLDGAMHTIFVKIKTIKKTRAVWKQNYWGNVYLNEIKILQ
ncbi:MAG: ATP-binding cassette domain-containing protein [Clostridia bacterium]|nr:ATP-binding cassette domain-containing protein [Clostridia bacterium]